LRAIWSNAYACTHGYSNSNAIRDANTYTEACSNTKAAAYPGAAPNC
jgi:hypothetical protein